MINCCICGELIVKYELDVEDTVTLFEDDKRVYICDRCSYNIALQRIAR